MKAAKWSHKKRKNLAQGSYRFYGKNHDREFVLVDVVTEREFSFESHEAAKKAGWVKS